MYLKKDNKKNLLKVDDLYATLKKIHSNGMLEFEFRYAINQSDAIKNSNTKVGLTVYTRTVKKRKILDVAVAGKIDTENLVENILTDFTAAKTALKQQDQYVLYHGYSDITAYIDNQIVADIRSGKQIKDIPALFKSKLKLIPAGELKQKNEVKPLLYNIGLSAEDLQQKTLSSLNEDNRTLSYDLILKKGLDPSEISAVTPTAISAFQSYQGLNKNKNLLFKNESLLFRLYDQLTLQSDLPNKLEKSSNDIDDSKMIDTISVESVDQLIIPVITRFVLPKDVFNVYVRFDLLDPLTGATVDSITKFLSVFDHIKAFNTPIGSPTIFCSKINANKSCLLIKQTDENANSIHLYKKNIYLYDTKVDNYELVGKYSLNPNQTRQINVQRPLNGAVIYRCISAKDNILSSAYANVVVNSVKSNTVKSSTLTSVLSDNGILLEARGISSSAVSIQFLKRNLSVFQKEFVPVSNQLLIDKQIRQSDYISTFVSDLIDSNIYEFKLKLFFKNGISESVDSEIIEYVKPEQDKVDISITDPVVTVSDISFNIDLSVSDGDIDQIKNLLKKQGIDQFFQDDIQKQRDELKNLLGCTVQRINLTTGEKEFFGSFTGERFSDLELRKKTAVKPLQPGQRYRYIITASIRSPETVFNKFKKTGLDLITKKSYTFNPAKFFHPHTLKRGMIFDISSNNKSKLGKSILEHGALGATKHVDFSFSGREASILELNASNFDLRKNIITWRVQGDISLIDHFVVMKQVHGIRTIIGNAHNIFYDGNCQWIHKLTRDDRGQLQYVVLPVFNDYAHGQALTSNTLLIEDL